VQLYPDAAKKGPLIVLNGDGRPMLEDLERHCKRAKGSREPTIAFTRYRRNWLAGWLHFCAAISRYTARIRVSSRRRPSAQALNGDAGDELGKLSEIMRVSGDDEVATKRGRGDYGRVDGVRACRAGEQLARALSELRCQRLDSTAF
jgi:hypothetical protein